MIDLISENPEHKFAPYQRMANAIIDLTQKNGGCLPQDLLALGFTKEETVEQWHMSQAMANAELNPSSTRSKVFLWRAITNIILFAHLLIKKIIDKPWNSFKSTFFEENLHLSPGKTSNSTLAYARPLLELGYAGLKNLNEYGPSTDQF